jgi:hypothetical protein
VAGGAIKWNDRPAYFDNITESKFQDNWAVYGNNIASYAVCVVKVQSDSDHYNGTVCFNSEVNRGREIITRFNMLRVASGQPAVNNNNNKSEKYEPLFFALIDHYDNRIKSDNSSKLSIIPIAKLTADNENWD